MTEDDGTNRYNTEAAKTDIEESPYWSVTGGGKPVQWSAVQCSGQS